MKNATKLRLVRLGAAILFAMGGLAGAAGYGQGSYPSPIQITPDPAGTNVVYSPTLVTQTINGTSTLVLYFGGWYQPVAGQRQNDSIYRQVCSAPNSCGTPTKVINPVADGLGLYSLVNDPTIVTITPSSGPSYYIMYMTGVVGANAMNPSQGFDACNNWIYYSTSWTTDGVNWSTPTQLINAGFTPSATVNSAGHVILYANGNYTLPAKIMPGTTCPTTINNANMGVPLLGEYDLGTNGVTPGAVTSVSTVNAQGASVSYDNVEVQWRSSINAYQMVAQQLTSSLNSEIDYLYSTDGVHFTQQNDTIVGEQYVINHVTQPPVGLTPAAHPGTECWVYFGAQSPTNNTINVYLQSWC